jgi:deazaflavin-dependent oxidoreductase (nitroreductase family)
MALSGKTLTDTTASSAGRSFPLSTTMLYELLNDAQYKKNFHARLQGSNRFMVFFYKIRLLPLLGLGKQMMLLTTQGRTSHKQRDFPIGYYLIDGVVHVFSGWGKNANWYKNIIANPQDVFLQVGFDRFQAIPEFVEDSDEKRHAIERLIACCPEGASHLIGWDPQIDKIETADFSQMIDRVMVVRFHKR